MLQSEVDSDGSQTGKPMLAAFRDENLWKSLHFFLINCGNGATAAAFPGFAFNR